MMRRRRPVLRTAALVGGTAAVAHHAGVRSQQRQDAEYTQDAQIADLQQQQAMQQQAAMQAPAAAPLPQAPAKTGPSEEDMARLKQLADLHEQGVLTDEEFAQQKGKILGY